MLYYKDKQYNLVKEKIKYKQDGEELTNHIGQEGKQWWLDFEEKWEDMEILEVKRIKVTELQEARLEEVNQLNIPEGYDSLLDNYVSHGKFPDEFSHLLKDIETKKNNESTEEMLLQTTMLLAQEQEKNSNNEEAILELTTMMGEMINNV